MMDDKTVYEVMEILNLSGVYYGICENLSRDILEHLELNGWVKK